MPKGRPCKYGDRDASGKCPPKASVVEEPVVATQQTKKQKPCKYGDRDVSGKCPPKPKTQKGRPCKYGDRDESGKCPPKPKTAKKVRIDYQTKKVIRKVKSPVKAKIAIEEDNKRKTPILESPENESIINVEVIMYEDGNQKTFEYYGTADLAAITETLMQMLSIPDNKINYKGDEDERMVIENVKSVNNKVGNRAYKYPINKKIEVELKEYSHPWGKIEFMFIPIKLDLIDTAAMQDTLYLVMYELNMNKARWVKDFTTMEGDICKMKVSADANNKINMDMMKNFSENLDKKLKNINMMLNDTENYPHRGQMQIANLRVEDVTRNDVLQMNIDGNNYTVESESEWNDGIHRLITFQCIPIYK
jgi:hypothetical protein